MLWPLLTSAAPDLADALEGLSRQHVRLDAARRTVETAPRSGMHLLVGFMDEVGTADQVEMILRHLPPQARGALPTVRQQGRSALTALGAPRR